jgi:hypothetical protein
MYNPVGASCKIGVMEKISRVGKFKDADSCEAKLLPRFFEEHGSELKFNREDLKSAAETILKHLPYNTRATTDDVLDSIYRRYAAILPYIDRWKGTNRSFDLLFKAIGIEPRVEYLWEDEEGNLVSEEEASDEYTLSSHLRLVLSSDLYTKAELNSLVPFTYKAVESVLPVTRVLEDVYIQENYTAVDHNESMTVVDRSIACTPVHTDQIKFTWNARSLKAAKITSDQIVIKIPVRSHKTKSDLIDAEFPIQDNCSFYFKRWDLTRKTRSDKTLKLTFKRNSNILTDLYIDPTSVILERDSVVLKGLSTASNVQSANSINMYRLDDTVDLEASFEYNRAVENYCVSILAN